MPLATFDTAALTRPNLDADFARIVDALTRHGFLAGGLGAATLLGLAACGSTDPSADASSTSAGAWSFTDDLRRTIRLPKRPGRVASSAAIPTSGPATSTATTRPC